jgi:hypothetical protein
MLGKTQDMKLAGGIPLLLEPDIGDLPLRTPRPFDLSKSPTNILARTSITSSR